MSAERNLNDRDIELLSAYLDDALSSEERAALDARLKAEPNLRRELAELRQTVALVHDFGRLRAPRDFTLTAAMARPPKILFFPATAAVSALSAVAAIVLVVAGALLLARSNPSTLSRLTGAAVASTHQIAFAPTMTSVPAQAQGGLPASPSSVATTGDFADNGTTFGAFAATPAVEAPGSLDLDIHMKDTSEATQTLGFAARSALPTQGYEAQAQVQTENQPEAADQFSAANSAASGMAAEQADQAAPPAPMMAAAAPPQGTPTMSDLLSMQMAVPDESGQSGGGGAQPAGAAAASAKAVAEEPTATASETSTSTATATLTATATASPTLTPTATATLTATPSATPSPTPAPTVPLGGSGTGLAGLALIVAGAAALILSLAVSLARRRA